MREAPPISLAADSPTSPGGAAGQSGEGKASPSPLLLPILALDQGKQEIGWARARADEAPQFSTFVPRNKPPDGVPYRLGDTLLSIEEFLRKQIALGVRVVVIETVFHDTRKSGNDDVFAKLSMVRAICHCTCEREGVRIEEIVPRTWRKHFLGFADSRSLPLADPAELKDEAIRMCARAGWSVSDHHQAEALGILSTVLARDYPQFASRWDPRLQGMVAK